ncbi:MAG: glycosyltransferase [Anaerolineae bacterium]
MIEDILNLSRLDAGPPEPELAAFAVMPLLQEMWDQMASLAQEAGVDLQIPTSAPALTVEADRNQIKNMLRNLMSNAIKFTPPEGIDILLDVYAQTFTADDDVCLVIKDAGGESFYKSQTAGEIIAEIQARPGAPEIEYIDRMLADDELAGLYTACDCLVHPYRGEGFGLPIAEAMACGLPVVVTGYGAALDFCSKETAYLISGQVVQLPHAERRVGEIETVDYPWWAEPDREHLQVLLRRVVANPGEARGKGRAAAAYIRDNVTWDHSASDEAHLYFCPQNLLKFHPDFDGILAAILRGDPLGRLVLLKARVERLNRDLLARFGRTMPDVVDRVLLLPQQHHHDYLNLIALSEVMLDTVHYSGGNTTHEGLAAGTPCGPKSWRPTPCCTTTSRPCANWSDFSEQLSTTVGRSRLQRDAFSPEVRLVVVASLSRSKRDLLLFKQRVAWHRR